MIRRSARPISANSGFATRHARRPLALFAAALVLAALAGAWTVGPLADAFDPASLAATADRLRDWPFAIVAVVAAFIAGNLVVAPGTLMIATTILLFGPVRGALYAYASMLVSGSLIYAIGRSTARTAVDDWISRRAGPRLSAFNARVARRGLIAVTLLRLMPIPFPIQSLALGASRIDYADFLGGTMLGLIPVTLILAGLAAQVEAWLASPDVAHLAILAGTAIAVLIVGWWLRRRIMRRG